MAFDTFILEVVSGTIEATFNFSRPTSNGGRVRARQGGNWVIGFYFTLGAPPESSFYDRVTWSLGSSSVSGSNAPTWIGVTPTTPTQTRRDPNTGRDVPYGANETQYGHIQGTVPQSLPVGQYTGRFGIGTD